MVSYGPRVVHSITVCYTKKLGVPSANSLGVPSSKNCFAVSHCHKYCPSKHYVRVTTEGVHEIIPSIYLSSTSAPTSRCKPMSCCVWHSLVVNPSHTHVSPLPIYMPSLRPWTSFNERVSLGANLCIPLYDGFYTSI